MKILKLYIGDYKKFTEKEIDFDLKKHNKYLEEIYGDINITALIGINGSGKTTILSMIVNIFRYLQRDQHKIPSDFKLKYELNNRIITIESENKNIFVKINNENRKLLLEMKRENGKSINFRKASQRGIKIEDITYDEFRKYLPSRVVVSGFDNEYNIDYNSQLICDRLVKFYNSYYLRSSYGQDLSLGILRFYIQYFGNNRLLNDIFNSIDIHFSEHIAIRYSPPELIKLDRDQKDFDYNEYILIGNKYVSKLHEPLIKELKRMLKKYKITAIDYSIWLILHPQFFDNYCEGMLEDNFNTRFNIKKFLTSDDSSKELLEILIRNNVLYINDIYIINEKEYRMERMSTGEKMILGRLFFILNNIERNSVIIIEEPEVHLNYLWVKQIVSIFILLFKEYAIHLLLSSHNYSFINNLFPEQILLLDNEGVRNPEGNTLLADEEIILNMISSTNHRKDNYVEDIVFKIIENGNREQIKYYFENLGESYIKILLYKKLVEMGEINVESDK